MLATMRISRWAGTAEASDLGLRPGEWPPAVEWQGQTWRRYLPVRHGDELVAVRYNDGDEYILIIND